MGIRVNKMIGYGLADLAVTDGKLTDRRINAASPLLTYDDNATLDAFQAWLEARTDYDAQMEAATLRHLAAGSAERRVMTPDKAIAYNPEYGLPNVLCLRPVWTFDWRRHDDIIDYIEETYLGSSRGIMPQVNVFPHGIYPYNGSYMDTRTGQRLDDNVMPWIRLSADADEKEDAGILDVLATAICRRQSPDSGPVFTGHAEAARYVAPRIPEGIALLAEWGELFTDPAMVRQLRPMRYVWWS